MRKKYLSALLFGALLFASAGTFTSCKDYDDDINNLQTQIDQVASDLNDLKTKVDALGGWVENVTFADGVLSVTTGGNTVTYNIPDNTGVNNVTLALDGNNLVLDVDGTKQTIALPEAETPEIPEIKVEDGILYVGDKEYPLTVDVDNNVTIVESTIPGNETYTVMVNGEEVTFAKAFADVRISLQSENNGTDGFYFTECGLSGNADSEQKNGIHWARADKEVAWDGPKGNITKDMLVVGQTTAAKVSVRPINYDLKAHQDELSLVSSTGKTARASVIVYSSQDEGPLHNGTRSNITYEDVKQGDYVLGIALNSDLKDEDVVTAFATEDGNHNVKYALAINGTVVTDYNFIIDTQLKADAQPSAPKFDADKFKIGGMGTATGTTVSDVPTGTHQISYLDGRIYDMKVELDESSVSDANVYGVKVNTDKTTGITSITASENAENRSFKLKVTLIDVNGNISKEEVITVSFKKAESGQVVTLDASTYKVYPNSHSFVINLGDVFTSLSDEDAITLKNNNKIEWAIEDKDDNFVVSKNIFDAAFYQTNIEYYKDEACTQDVYLNDRTTGEAVKSIRYAKVTIPQGYENASATVGEHLLSITLLRETGIPGGTMVEKTIKKVNIPMHVQIPEWDELFQTTTAWKDGEFVTRLINVNPYLKQAQVSMNAFTAEKTDWKDEALKIDLIKLKYNDKFDGNNEKDAQASSIMPEIGNYPVALKYDELTKETDKTHELAYSTMSATAEYQYKAYTNFKRTKDFTVRIMSIFEGAQLQYDGKVQDAVLSANDVIDGNKLKLVLNGQSVKLKDGTGLSDQAECIVGGKLLYDINKNISMLFTEQSGASATIGNINFVQTAQTNSLIQPEAVLTDEGVRIKGKSGMINSGEGGTYTIEFYDCMNVKTSQNVKFTKK